MKLHPLPVKTRTSFDILKLLDMIRAKGEFYTDASFADLLVVRNYIGRHKMDVRLSQEVLKTDDPVPQTVGYRLRLVPV